METESGAVCTVVQDLLPCSVRPESWCSLPGGIKSTVKAVNSLCCVVSDHKINTHEPVFCLYITQASFLIWGTVDKVIQWAPSMKSFVFLFFKKAGAQLFAECSKYYLLFVNHLPWSLPERSTLLVVEKWMGCWVGMLVVWYHVWWAVAFQHRRDRSPCGDGFLLSSWQSPRSPKFHL